MVHTALLETAALGGFATSHALTTLVNYPTVSPILMTTDAEHQNSLLRIPVDQLSQAEIENAILKEMRWIGYTHLCIEKASAPNKDKIPFLKILIRTHSQEARFVLPFKPKKFLSPLRIRNIRVDRTPSDFKKKDEAALLEAFVGGSLTHSSGRSIWNTHLTDK